MVSTTDLSNSIDIFFAPAKGATGSAVLLMNRIGKLVFPPILEPKCNQIIATRENV
jgi:hypothetical protein